MMQLLNTRRFGPFFWTQFFGAFNDNVFKNALVILIAFKAASEADAGLWVNLATGLFILPFFLFSPIAGQLADKLEKAAFIRTVKLCEIAIMILGAIGFFTGNIVFLISILFFMGTQSTFFGPVKYSILPQQLEDHELMTGTSLVEMGTFVSILSGTIMGGVLIRLGSNYVSIAVLIFAVLGWLTSRRIPKTPALAPNLKVTLNPYTELKNLYKISKQNDSIYYSIVGISWFWFLGATVLAQIPTFVGHTLNANEYVVTLLLAIFTLSIALGSYISDKLADSKIELGIVPIGALGMSIFIFDMGIIPYELFSYKDATILDFLWNRTSLNHYRVLVDLGLVGFFGSFFIVPLYAILQQRSEKETCSRVIAANNILNALFMVGSAVLALVLFSMGFKTHDIFIIIAFMNLAVCGYIFTLLPEFFMRLVIWMLAKTIYTLRYVGRKNIPHHGPVVLVANHISFIDWFILSAACQRPIRFVMDHLIFKTPVLGMLFKFGKCIPIAPAKQDPEIKDRAFTMIKAALDEGDIVCIFPEGAISADGELKPFKPGIERILEENKVPVIPIGLNGLWGSFFSRKSGKAMSSVPKPRRRTITVNIGKPFGPNEIDAKGLELQVAALLSEA